MEKGNLTVNYVLSTFLNCGYSDTEFFLKELDNWSISFEEVHEYIADCGEYYSNPLINTYIYVLYELAFDKACREIGVDACELDLEQEFYINCLDSHFYVNVSGYIHEFYDIEEFKIFIRIMYKKII